MKRYRVSAKIHDFGHSDRNSDDYKTAKKASFNEIFASKVVKLYTKHQGNVLYLDHIGCATTTALRQEGIKLKHLYSPNCNEQVVATLRNRRINTAKQYFEQYVGGKKHSVF